MLIDDLKEQLKALQPDLAIIEKYWSLSRLEDQYQKLLAITQAEHFWQHENQAEILKEFQGIKTLYDQHQYISKTAQELSEFLTLFGQDVAELERLKQEIVNFARDVKKFKVMLLLNNPDDHSNCFFSINAGAGGTESQDWANMLLRMYVRFCEREHLESALLDIQPGETAGIKSATLYIKGKNAYGLLKGEEGIHRLVRISPFDANKRRHTSFAAVSATPEAPSVAITIDPKDLRIDTYRAGGAGGQHVNKTESAVRITHLPTGVVVQCQNERSQNQNRETAMKMLMAKLVQRQKEEEAAKRAAIEKKKIEWGSQIRSYVLHPYKMVKDHRTDIESPQPDLVLDGDLMEFIENYLIWAGSTKA
jgi:peptide chain release factor 2